MRVLVCGLALVALGLSGATAQTESLPPVAVAVQKYVLEVEYPEQFGNKSYRMRAENLVIADLDGDGQREAIAHYVPHYRQSPMIVIYRVASDMTVTRVREGLAPGPLRPLTGDYLDSHATDAADIDIADRQTDPASRRKLVESILEQFGSVVEYANFFHVDARNGGGTYIDMTGVPTPDDQTCEDFEFSAVDGISVGIVPAIGDSVLLAAWVSDKVYLYQITAFTSSGMMDKEMWTVDVGPDFKGFPEGPRRELEYLTTSGDAKPFLVTCRGNLCKQLEG